MIVEWNNVTAGYDIEAAWFQSHDYFTQAGYVWIGLTAQRVGVDALKRWSPRRYGTLDVTAGGTITNDDLSYDVLADVGRIVRRPVELDILGGLRAQRVFAPEWSQSGGRLAPPFPEPATGSLLECVVKCHMSTLSQAGEVRIEPTYDEMC